MSRYYSETMSKKGFKSDLIYHPANYSDNIPGYIADPKAKVSRILSMSGTDNAFEFVHQLRRFNKEDLTKYTQDFNKIRNSFRNRILKSYYKHLKKAGNILGELLRLPYSQVYVGRLELIVINKKYKKLLKIITLEKEKIDINFNYLPEAYLRAGIGSENSHRFYMSYNFLFSYTENSDNDLNFSSGASHQEIMMRLRILLSTNMDPVTFFILMMIWI